MATIQDLGKVAYFNKGMYNSETNYEINDVVSYNGSSYVSLLNNNQGNLPTNATYWSVVALKGDKGDTGKPFVIEKTYESIEDMVADYDNMQVNDYVMIQGNIEEEENATLWTKTETEVSPYKWVFLADFSGASGITGATPNIQIGTVTEGNEPSVTRRAGSSNENPILDFVLKTGATGQTGATGNGISSVSKTSTSGLTDTYTITYTNGNTTTFDVSNGNGIDRIEKTATVGNKDTYTIYFTNGSTTTYEVANGEVTREELEEEVDRLSMIYNAFPSTSNEGEEITLDGTAEVPFKKLNLKGNTSQFSTTGKNLLPNEATTTTKNGITFTKNSDGTYTVSGTATANAIFSILVEDASTNPTLQAGTYTLSGCPSGGSVNTYKLDISVGSYNQDLGSGVTFTLSEATQINYVRILVYNGQTINTVFKPMIESGNTKTSFEPYTNGPAPNPSYPYPVNVVTGNNSIKVEGKNLFDGIYVKLFTSGSSPYDCSYDNNVRSAIVKVKPNTTYTISKESSNRFRIGQYDEMPVLNLPSIKFNMVGDTLTNYTITTENKTEYLLIQLSNNNEEPLTQVELGNIVSEYEPYQSQTYPINLGNIELCKIGDYQDYIYKDNGKWYKHKEVEKGTIDDFGNINTVTSTLANNLYGFAMTIAPIKTSYNSLGSVISNVLSPKVLGSASDTTDPNNVRFNQGISKQINNTQIIITVDKSYLSTGATTELSPFLQSVGFYFYYVLNQATDELITDTTLINQLDQMEKAYSYDTQTNISQTNADKPFILDVEAILSLKNILN